MLCFYTDSNAFIARARLEIIEVQQLAVCFSLKHPGRAVNSPPLLLPSPFHSQTLVLLRHALNARSSSLETLCFFLTLLAPAVTPLFVLSERWIHMPCGCFINCKRDSRREPSGEALQKTPKAVHASKFSNNCGINWNCFVFVTQPSVFLSFPQ